MTFTADTATYYVIEGAHVTGLATGNGSGGYLIFQRSGKTVSGDLGVYVELNDQSNSGYGLIRECRIGREEVVVDLTQALTGAVTIRVKLSVDDEAFREFMEGMNNVFRGSDNLFVMNA
jgi:hypothetical protein